MSNQLPVTIEDLWLIKETEKACLVKHDEGQEAWIPKSMIVRMEKGKYHESIRWTQIDVLEIPEWLAEQNGLI